MQSYMKGGVAYDAYGNPLPTPVTDVPRHSEPTPAPLMQMLSPVPSMGVSAPSPAASFDSRSPASWADYRARARAGTQGVNRMPGVFSNYAQVPQMNPMDVLRMLFPTAPDNAPIGLNGGAPFTRPAPPAAPTPDPDAQTKGSLFGLLGMPQAPATDPVRQALMKMNADYEASRP